MDLKDTAKQLRQILLLLQESGFTMPIILTSIDRYGSVMLAEYTTVHGKNIATNPLASHGSHSALMRWSSTVRRSQ